MDEEPSNLLGLMSMNILNSKEYLMARQEIKILYFDLQSL